MSAIRTMQLPLHVAWLVQEGSANGVLPGLGERASEALTHWLPVAVTGVLIAAVLVGVRKVLDRSRRDAGEHQLRDQLVMLGLTLVGLLGIVLVLPISDSARSDVLNLLGVVLSAAIALSSTSFLSNAMAALMLRAERNFKLGDFIQVSEHFGRVTERGLFHIEIQTEDRDLVTLPNMFLITNPVRVTRSTGTVVSCEVSLGYDIPRLRIEPLLIQAAEQAGLADPFVQVTELGDFSVTYRIAGLLGEVKQLISLRSGLRKAVMDALHEGGVEIVSPTFMNTRAFDPQQAFVPQVQAATSVGKATDEKPPEDVIFDKADEAEHLVASRKRLAECELQIKQLKERRGDDAAAVKDQLKQLELEREALSQEVKDLTAQLAQADH